MAKITKKQKVDLGRLGKNEIIRAVADKTGMTKKDTTEFFNAYVETVRDGLIAGRSVGIHELGTFNIKIMKERQGKDRETGAEVVIPSGKKVRFTVSSVLKSQFE